MNVHFDAITEVPSDKELEAVNARVRLREERRRKGTQLRRQQMLEQAMALYLEAGDSGFRMRDLAERCGYTAGALYMYFKDRDALLDAMHEQLIGDLAGEMVKAAGKLQSRKTAVQSGRDVATASLRHLGQIWWRALALDGHRRALLLRSVTSPIADSSADAGDSALAYSPVLRTLLAAVEPAIANLTKVGISAEAALSLHADWVTWVVGQCVLAGPVVNESALMEMERVFLDRMEREAMAALTGDGREPAAKPDTAQSDLFF